MVLYGCGTWSLKLREERRLRVFESRVLRGIFGPRERTEGVWEQGAEKNRWTKEKLTGGRRKLLNEERNNV
jgi:hypothetical protein